MEYLYTARFLRSLKNLESSVQDDVFDAVSRFEKGETETLKLHKLHGKFSNRHAFSANFAIRIIVKIEKSATYYMDVGSHEVYR